MIEISGLILAVVGIVFAFEAPRTKFLSVLGQQPSLKTTVIHNAGGQDVLSSHDRELAKSFRSLFADSGLFREFQGHDFLLPLRKIATVPLYMVVETWTDEAHFFTHPELRSKQAIFIAAASELAGEIVRYTVPDGNGNVSGKGSQCAAHSRRASGVCFRICSFSSTPISRRCASCLGCTGMAKSRWNGGAARRSRGRARAGG